jgi:hypothetical protein
MPLSSNNRRKSSEVTHPEKTKSTNKHNETKSGTHGKTETHEQMVSTQKSEIPVFMNAHRKSDAEAQEKVDHGGNDFE